MKSYKIWQEGWFSKKEPEDKDEEELQSNIDNVSLLFNSSAAL